MSIKAVFLAGQTDITVNGLHQWDYGQQLEIRASDLPALIEVHFACAGMTDAVVRACSGTLGVYRAAIPDACLEQTSPVVAWIYRIDGVGTAGATVKTITLPIIARTRPQANATVPEIITDKYTELIAAINAEVETLARGDVVVAEARDADEAKHAVSADTAAALELPAGFVEHTYGEEMESGLYVMRFTMYGQNGDLLGIHQAVIGIFAVTNSTDICLSETDNSENKFKATVRDNKVTVWINSGVTDGYEEISTVKEHRCEIMYKKICS